MRRWSSLAALAALALVAGACGGDDDEATTAAAAETTAAAEEETTEATEAPAEETTEATEAPAEETTQATEAPTETTGTETTLPTRADADLVIWADEQRVETLQPFADAFAADNGVTVALQELQFGQIRDQLLVAGPAGEGPDIIIGAHDWLGQLVTDGVVAPVDLPNAGDFLDVAIQAFTYDGQLFGVPYAVENIALIRNTDLVPEAPATFEEVEQVALEVVAAGGASVPLALQNTPADSYHNYPMFSALGGYVFGQNEDGTYNPDDLGIDSPGGLAAADQFAAWVESGFLNPDIDYGAMINAFGSGDAPFAITGPWAITSPDPPGFQAQGVAYAVDPFPPLAGGEPRPFVGVQGFMVSAFAPSPLLAQTFVVDVMATEEAQTALYEAGGRPPALSSAFDAASADPDIQGFGAAGAAGQPLPAIPEMGSVWTAWQDAYTLIFTGGAEPQQAFTDAAAQIRELIAGG